ncbi:MAG: methyltransferase domain-containing protein [archaeon]
MVNLLFPGRHHILTKFQHNYLKDLVDKGIKGKKIDEIIFAVTSANHSNTRRNPIPLYLRTLAIARFCSDFKCKVKVYPVPDVKATDKFAKYIIGQIFYQGGEKLTPKNTVLACSTPNVISLFKEMKFENIPVELADEKKGKYCTLRPYEIIDLLVKSGDKWKTSKIWKRYTAEASQQVYDEYSLGDLIIELFNDSLLNEDADITNTRDYNTYARGMDKNIEFKFADIRQFIKEGKIVDAGCGTGALINLLAKEFKESDIIGIEATRKFYEFCRMQDYPSPLVFFYRRNIIDQNFKNNTINTFVYSSVLHEIYSYIGKNALINVLKNTYNQIAPDGNMIIRDVVGPENPDKIVYMELNNKDGKDNGQIGELSTYARFFIFAREFMPRKIKFKEEIINSKKLIRIRLQDAYEYMSKMSYIDNWQSEMHEEFGFWSFSRWKKELEKIGFKISAGSKKFKSEYIIKNMYIGKVKLHTKENGKLVNEEYPPTNMVLAAEKQLL